MSFEDKKQEIINDVNKIADWHEWDGEAANIVWRLINNVKQLTLHKPPTCASCKSFTLELSNSGTCNKGMGCDFISFVDGVNPIVFIDFGCIHHSDYERKEDENI